METAKIKGSLNSILHNRTKSKTIVNGQTISVYENLPSGGAQVLYESNINYLKKKLKLNIISDKSETEKIKGLFSYLTYILLENPRLAQSYRENLSTTNLLVAYHTWVTKSPNILRQDSIPEIYICHEAPREFYDREYRKNFTLKDRFINLVRFVVKVIDRKNVLTNKDLKIIVNSKFSAKKILQIYGKQSHVIYPGINIHKYGKYRGIKDRKEQIICVGAINKLKNQKFIIEAINKLDKVKKPKVVFIGNGGDRGYIANIQKFAKKHNIDLKIMQNITERELITEYKKSKLFCYAPINEPFGLVVIEALRSGLPIVVSKTGGGYTEVISSKNGFILTPNDQTSWSNAIEKLLTNNKLWEKYSQYNYMFASKFSDKKMNKELLKEILWKIQKS